MIFAFSIIGRGVRKPKNLGLRNGRLAGCHSSPNCVSTFAKLPSHKMEPIPFSSSPEEARACLRGIIGSLKRCQIVTETDNYIYAEFTSALLRFVDDVEFYFDEKEKLIQFRSASRVGYSDFGMNRKRMEEITKHFLMMG